MRLFIARLSEQIGPCSPATNTCFLLPQPPVLFIPLHKGMRVCPHHWFPSTFCQLFPPGLGQWKEAEKFNTKSFLFFFHILLTPRVYYFKKIFYHQARIYWRLLRVRSIGKKSTIQKLKAKSFHSIFNLKPPFSAKMSPTIKIRSFF